MADSKSGAGGTLETTPTTKPYLLRAIYEWCVDSGFTPQILVDASQEEVHVPQQFVQDNRIILNIHPQSVKELQLGNEYLLFSARFGGKPHALTVPVSAVLAIYSRENGQGIVFQDEVADRETANKESVTDAETDGQPSSSGVDKPGPKGGSHLKLIK